MKFFDGKVYRDMTPEEIAALEAIIAAAPVDAERDYWLDIPYDEAVNAEIRKRYTVSQEFALLRQKDTKPEEYAEYFAYCEQCKVFVKSKKEEYENG